MRRARRIREECGMSLEDVTRETSISAGHLARFERGVANLGTQKLLELSRVLKTPIDELLTEAEPADPLGIFIEKARKLRAELQERYGVFSSRAIDQQMWESREERTL